MGFLRQYEILYKKARTEFHDDLDDVDKYIRIVSELLEFVDMKIRG